MRYHIASVQALNYPVVRVSFDDGLAGDYDLSEAIGHGALTKPLEDPSSFRSVAVTADGRSFGWRLDDPGNEIDFCADAIRIRIETAAVERLAARYAESRSAAE